MDDDGLIFPPKKVERFAMVPRNDYDRLVAENARLREIVYAPLSPVELRLVDKNCGWLAFKHAWNAVMKRRQETIADEQKGMGNAPS